MIVLITPTGGRPKQFELCVQWMKRQTYTGKVVWIVVDDCVPITTDIITEDFREKWHIIKRHPKPVWRKGLNTQSRNLKIGIDIVKAFPQDWVEAIFIIEDDDYYRPTYLETMVKALQGFSLAGEVKTVYYNVNNRSFKINSNTAHTSLFQVCFAPNVIPAFESCFGDKFIDVNFCKKINNKNLFESVQLSIGIKGLPGRAGIGKGHVLKGTPDSDLKKLKELLGQDYKYYV